MTNGLKNFLCFFSGLKDEKESLKKDLTEFKNNTEESLKHLEEITEEHNQDLDKLENDLKMGLEEEKMLRGQDMGILKFNLNEGMKEIKEGQEQYINMGFPIASSVIFPIDAGFVQDVLFNLHSIHQCKNEQTFMD